MRTCAAVAAVLTTLSEGVLEGARQCVARAGTYIPQITASLTGAETAGFPEGPRRLQAQAHWTLKLHRLNMPEP